MRKLLKVFTLTNVFVLFASLAFAQTIIGYERTDSISVTQYECPRGQVFFYDPVYEQGYCGISTKYPYANMYTSPTGVTPSAIYSDTFTRQNQKVCSTYVYPNNKKYTYCQNSISAVPSYVYQEPTYVYYGTGDATSPFVYYQQTEERAIVGSPRCPSSFMYIPGANMCASPSKPVQIN